MEVDLGRRITLICGKNGTSKSTILGVAAQIFSFDSDFSKNPGEPLAYETISGSDFKSAFANHFRISEKHDNPGEMDIEIDLYDGAFKQEIDGLKLRLYKSNDRSKARPVVRDNIPSLSSKNTSRNVTHPVIYLSLSRLIPVSERKKYRIKDINYLEENKKTFRDWSSKILNNDRLSDVTATDGNVKSAVAHGDNYDQDSVSVGEDNVGQLVLALMSFEKLKKEYPDYHGGLLLIDEADAGLFPAAQVDFVELLAKVTRDLNIQIIMTSHSPLLIEKVKEYSERDASKYKTIYLTNTFGEIQAKHDWGWAEIFSDLHTVTTGAAKKTGKKLPRVNVYFEDSEANDFFNAIVRKRSINKVIFKVVDVSLGCKQYTTLIKAGVKEFSKNSLVILDADADTKGVEKTCLKLPGMVPPDQLLFEFLFKLPRDDYYWEHNSIGFSKDVFLRNARAITQRLGITENEATEDFCLLDYVRRDSVTGKPLREIFKEFYKCEDIQRIVHGSVKDNPYRYWVEKNNIEVNGFNAELVSKLKKVCRDVYGIPENELASIGS